MTRTRTRYPDKGDAFTFTRHVGYVLAQDRPMACRGYGQFPDGSHGYGCKCGNCNGRSLSFEGVVAEVILWMDNSVEVVSEPDADGRVWRQTTVAPHGDVC